MKSLKTRATLLSYLSLSLLLSSCGLKTPDVEICVTLPSKGAFCSYTISDIEREINSSEWSEMQVGRFSMTPQSFSEYQKFVIEACARYKCSAADKKKLDSFVKKMGLTK